VAGGRAEVDSGTSWDFSAQGLQVSTLVDGFVPASGVRLVLKNEINGIPR